MTERRPAVANETGIRADPRLGATLDLAAALQPDTKQVFVITGASSTDKTYEKLAREQLKPFQSRFAVTYLAGLPMHELEGRLATLPPRSIVFFVIVYEDGEGDNFHPWSRWSASRAWQMPRSTAGSIRLWTVESWAAA